MLQMDLFISTLCLQCKCSSHLSTSNIGYELLEKYPSGAFIIRPSGIFDFNFDDISFCCQQPHSSTYIMGTCPIVFSATSQRSEVRDSESARGNGSWEHGAGQLRCPAPRSGEAPGGLRSATVAQTQTAQPMVA